MTQTATPVGSDKPFQVEQRGIDIVPESERHGHPAELFWIWAASLMGIVDLVIGAVVISLGLSLWAAVAAVIIGNLSYVLVGLVAMNGPAAGTSTIVISRSAFGVRGNAVPTVFSWLTILLWEGVNAVVGTLALIGIFATYGLDGTGYKVLSLIIFLILMVTWAIFGHATITSINRVMTYVIGAAMCIVLAHGFQHVNWHYGWSTSLAGSNKTTTFILAVMIVAAADLGGRIEAAAAQVGVAGTVTRAGSIMHVHLRPARPGSAEEADEVPPQWQAALHLALLAEGVYAAPRGMLNLSTALDDALLDRVAAGYERAFARIRDLVASRPTAPSGERSRP